jgi:hypothetical protein
MVEEQSRVKQLSLNHVFKIGVKVYCTALDLVNYNSSQFRVHLLIDIQYMS